MARRTEQLRGQQFGDLNEVRGVYQGGWEHGQDKGIHTLLHSTGAIACVNEQRRFEGWLVDRVEADCRTLALSNSGYPGTQLPYSSVVLYHQSFQTPLTPDKYRYSCSASMRQQGKGWGEGIWKSGIKSATYQVLPSAVGCQGHYTQSSKLLVARTARDINGPPGVASDLDRGGDDDVETSAAVMMEMEMALAPVDWRCRRTLIRNLERCSNHSQRRPLARVSPTDRVMVVSAPREEVKSVLHCIVRMSKTTNHALFFMHLAAQTGHGVSEFRVHSKSQERMGQTEARDATPTSDHGSSLKPQSKRGTQPALGSRSNPSNCQTHTWNPVVAKMSSHPEDSHLMSCRPLFSSGSPT
ncbi:hypothetical protein V496_03533 [Pseudogymnoascus sp. VKM F-4515 (FW-2607)]|nr:hypothetical protein V496_03533 [Pseudogymnoascus sp. VKM F-4515 (FW-2607)]